MAYKDKDKQREANRERQRRYKAKQKALPEQGVTDKALPNFNIECSPPSEPRDAPLRDVCIGTIRTADSNLEPIVSFGKKRGKDIKCFADLPPDVQATINRISESNEEKQKRTATAIKYQHLFPGRYYSQSAGGVACGCEASVTGKPGDADYNGVCTDEWRKGRGRGAAL